ncbi:MAG: hypothetical protein PHD32_07480 [Eubacteriales bacterium]|nr:hypothetical protein [Eubacteriales bacterium]
MAADAIEELMAEIEHIRQTSVSHEVYQMVCAERDAAVKDIMCKDHCDVCKHSRENNCNCDAADFDCLVCKEESCTCRGCRDENKWEWRGKEHI